MCREYADGRISLFTGIQLLLSVWYRLDLLAPDPPLIHPTRSFPEVLSQQAPSTVHTAEERLGPKSLDQLSCYVERYPEISPRSRMVDGQAYGLCTLSEKRKDADRREGRKSQKER